jgi:hypothetical protein
MTKPTRTKFDDKSGGNVTKADDKPTPHELAEKWLDAYAREAGPSWNEADWDVAEQVWLAGYDAGRAAALDRAAELAEENHGKMAQWSHATCPPRLVPAMGNPIAEAIRAEKERV